jgi:hypothetical protein
MVPVASMRRDDRPNAPLNTSWLRCHSDDGHIAQQLASPIPLLPQHQLTAGIAQGPRYGLSTMPAPGLAPFGSGWTDGGESLSPPQAAIGH